MSIRNATTVAALLAAATSISLVGACGDDSGDAAGTGGGAASSSAGSTSTVSTTATTASGRGGGGTDAGAGGSTPDTVSVEGDVLAFLTEVPGPRIAGATVTVLEHPEMTVVTGADAHFRFEGLVPGEDFTLLVEHEDIKPTQTATLTVGPGGIDPLSVQVLPKTLFAALSALVPLPIEEDMHCVIASTAARFGGSLYVHLRQGLPDVEVALSPTPPEGSGPIYFNEEVLPDPGQPATSIDGGVFFYRVPPGNYTMSATREGYAFNTVRFQCRAGIVVNAGPPLGLLAHVLAPDYSAGLDRPADDDSDATDSLCDATAACVNERGDAGDYPDATVTSCKAMFRNVWAQVDEVCDEGRALRDAAAAVYACRSESCDQTLGADDVCVGEEEAFRDAEAIYGACVADGA